MAHLPGRVFVYKFLSTFIDDLFAFLIRMPTLHRLRVFRDDIVFFVYLYQRWIYPVDKKRIEIGADFADVSLAEVHPLGRLCTFSLCRSKLPRRRSEPRMRVRRQKRNERKVCGVRDLGVIGVTSIYTTDNPSYG